MVMIVLAQRSVEIDTATHVGIASMQAGVKTALANLRAEIAEAESNADFVSNGQEELLVARKELAAELREDLRQLGLVEEEEEHQEIEGTWTDYGRRKCDTELIIMGLGAEFEEYALAAILGGGSKIRTITITAKEPKEVYVNYYLKEDATVGLNTASTAITNAGGPETITTRAWFNRDFHDHEDNPRAPVPKYTPYPSLSSTWTNYGQGDEGDQEGSWKDYSKADIWVTKKWNTKSTETISSTGASSSTMYSDPEDARSKKRSRMA
jgi:hypothetical protein